MIPRRDVAPAVQAPNSIPENGECTVTVFVTSSVCGHSLSFTSMIQVISAPVAGSLRLCISQRHPHDSVEVAGSPEEQNVVSVGAIWPLVTVKCVQSVVI